MSGQDFRAAVEAIARRESVPAPEPRPLDTVAVLGAGPLGQLLAAEALAAGCDVRLFSAFSRELERLVGAGTVTVRGRHLVGSYAVSEAPGTEARPAIRLCSAVDSAVAGADVVMVATPASVHSTYAGLLSQTLADGQTVVLVPGRFLGTVEFGRTLARHGCAADVCLAESSGPPYLVRRDGARLVVDGVARAVPLACLGSDAEPVAAALRRVWPMFVAVPGVLDTAFAGLTGVLNVAPVVLNVVAAQSDEPPLLRDLVTPELSRSIIGRLDAERRDVAFAYGVRDLPSAAGALAAAFASDAEEVAGDDVSVALDAIDVFGDYPSSGDGGPHVSDDVPNMLVPLASAGREAGVDTAATDALIALASVLVDRDFARQGRRMDVLGLTGCPPHELRRLLATPGVVARAYSPWRRV